MTAVDGEAMAAVHEYLGEEPLAGGFFRVRWSGELEGGRLGMLITAIRWLAARVRSGLPPYSFVAVTPVAVHFFEFRFRPTRLRREVGCWTVGSLEAAADGTNPFALDVVLDNRRVELAAVDEAGRGVIHLITRPG